MPVVDLVRQVGARPRGIRLTHAVDSTPTDHARGNEDPLGFESHGLTGGVAGYRSDMTTTADHVRNALDGRWRDMKNRMRQELSSEVFRPHYTPNTVIARTKVNEQMRIMAANGAAEDGFKKEHGGNGDVGAAVTQIEMLAMSDLSLMVKAGVQWGLFGGAIENLGTARHLSLIHI